MLWVQSDQESELEQREQQCHLEAERLRCEREALELQLLEYQQNLERLREGQRSVEREKEKVEAQQRLLQSWRHNRQSSLPVMIPLDGYQVGRMPSGEDGFWDVPPVNSLDTPWEFYCLFFHSQDYLTWLFWCVQGLCPNF